MPQSQVLRFAMAENGYISHEIVSGDRRKFVVMVFNALPPVSDDDWPLVIIVDSTNGTGRILVGKDGQICNTAALPKVLWRALKLVLDGQPI
ncbi:MAG: hypothetical protein Q7N50_10800 [Armatimonadota bacterium]|nr:hypothetical protein [Armatimonadota bacterium]